MVAIRRTVCAAGLSCARRGELHLRRSLPLLLLFSLILVAAVAAGCGGSSSVPKTGTNATLTAGSSPGTVSVAHPSGYQATITLPATSDGSSGSVAVDITTTLPSGVASPASAMKRKPATIGATVNPLVYLVLTPSANVNFTSSPTFSFTLPGGTTLAAGSSAFVAFYDPAQSASGWVTVLGPGAVSGQTIAFPGAAGVFSLKAGTPYVFVLFTTAQTVTAALSGPLLVVDLTQTNLPAGTPVYVYAVGAIKTKPGVSYWLKPLQATTSGTNVNQPVVAATMNPGSQNPSGGCANNGDDTNYYSCNNNQLNALPSPVASAINGGGGTGGNYPSAWADYSIPATVGTTLTMNLSAISAIPGLGTGTSAFSGRLYISVGTPKLPMTAISGGTYIAPAFGNNAGQPGEWTLYDWIEFSYDSGGNFDGNTTQVNAFGIPLQLSGTGIAARQVLNQSRSTILNYFAGLAPPYGGTGSSLGSVVVSPPAGTVGVAYPASATYLRAIAPQTIVAVGAYPTNGPLRSTFDSQIATAYAAWQSTPLVTNDESTSYYTGVVFPTTPTITPPSNYPAGSLAFYQGQFTTMSALATAVAGGATPAFYLTGANVNPGNQNIISSTDIWANDNSLAPPGAPSPAQLNVGKMLAAGFNRGVVVSPTNVVTTLLDDVACQDPSVESTFYPSGGTWNPWAQYFHSITSPISPNTTGLAYAFSYDDVCNQNPSIPLPGGSFKPGTVTVTVGNF